MPHTKKITVTLETLVSLAKRRGFVFQASEIYGGLAGFWDYGPYGVELVNNIKQLWWRAMVYEQPEIYGLDSAIVQNPKLWKASGHIDSFTDPLVDCKSCGARHRADHLAGLDTSDLKELALLLKDKPCPKCGKKTLTEPRFYNMMMKTWVGPVEDESSVAYLRPETAGSIFTNYDNVRETTRSKIPFGIAQIGKAFRNEISPRDFIFRVRELEQMEMQYFISPDMQKQQYERWREFCWDFLTERVGLAKDNLKWHEHGPDERAHYAAAAHDVYFNFPQGFKELWGTHNRTDFDLKNHIRESGKDLSYFDEATKERYVPNIIESSVGVGRMMMAVLTDAYNEEEVNGETRVVLKIDVKLAPVKVAILPLSKKPELSKLSREVYTKLVQSTNYNIEYDETQSIGKRYRRQDEIGTPYCVTIDFESLEDNAVTVRERDSMKQQRVKIDKLAEYIKI
ncbi:MAG TPA: glycine--tRNA ligase [Patescibacteria group bacterium]|jgi:glycyl-tRNA synthetase|nr:glycine--tRNA ligase [Patescibacteria group bacterium]